MMRVRVQNFFASTFSTRRFRGSRLLLLLVLLAGALATGQARASSRVARHDGSAEHLAVHAPALILGQVTAAPTLRERAAGAYGRIAPRLQPFFQRIRALRFLPSASSFEKVMVVLTFLYVVIALSQWYVIRRNVGRLERPWIIAAPQSINPQPPGFTSVKLKVSSCGRSPGWVTSLTVFFKKAKLAGLPKEPDYRCTADQEVGEFVLPPGGEHLEDRGYMISREESEEIANVNSSTYVLYGKIDYRDVIGKKHETRFCYVYRPPQKLLGMQIAPDSFVPGGPPSYTRHT